MSKGIFIFALMFAVVASFSGLTTQAAPSSERVIVTFDQALGASARSAVERAGGRIIRELPSVNGAAVLLPSEASMARFGALTGVRSIEKDARVSALKPPGGCTPWPECKDGTDDGGSTQPAETLEWGVDRIDAELAWSTSRGTAVKVAVIDTGIDRDHADLAGNLKGGMNFVSKSPVKTGDPDKWDDDNGHGTHVAGIIAAAANDVGVVGVAPEAHLYAVKVLDRNGSGYTSDVISGIDWAVSNGMQVVNMSLGSGSDVQALHDAVDAAHAAGVVVVAAAGNSGDGDGSTNEVSYPAKYASVIAVGATAADDSTPAWSSEGVEAELAAPGVSIRSTWNDGLYRTVSGTSMAAPHVAGTVALLLAMPVPAEHDADTDGTWDPEEIRTVLRATADDLGDAGHDNHYGHGLIDAEEAVTGTETHS